MVVAVFMLAPSLPWPLLVFGIVAFLIGLYIVIHEGGGSRLLVAALLASVLASACVHVTHGSVLYVPYCEGWWYYVNSLCWSW